MDSEFIQAFLLLLVLLNPFLLVLYMVDLLQEMKASAFATTLITAGLISVSVFVFFGVAGDVIFDQILQIHLSSFRVFGGIIFLIVGIRFVFNGAEAIKGLRGKDGNLSGAIALPIMVGPATLSAAMMAGKSLTLGYASLSIFGSVFTSVIIMIGLKLLHDYVQPRNERLVRRYIEIMGRVSAMYIGSISIEMIMTGLAEWYDHIQTLSEV